MNRRQFLTHGATGLLGAAWYSRGRRGSSRLAQAPSSIMIGNRSHRRREPRSDAPNVLFISVDDLNDWVGFLGPTDPAIERVVPPTPSMDALAQESLIFERAYTTVSMCMPARLSAMLGHSPLSNGFEGYFLPHWDDGAACVEQGLCHDQVVENHMSLADAFWLDGYYTALSGKIFHDTGKLVDRSWDAVDPDYRAERRKAQNDALADPTFQTHMANELIGWHITENESDHYDYGTASWCVDQINNQIGDTGRPFFLACGMYQPHIPFTIPRRFWEMNEGAPLVASRADAISDLDDLPDHVFGNDRLIRQELFADRLSDEDHRLLQQAYLSATSLADAQVGRVLDALADSPYADNTIVVLWSDHGWHLGQKRKWQKFSLWEIGTRVPFLIKVPGSQVFQPAQRYTHPVSLLDLYPTLLDITGVPGPRTPVDGQSLMPQLRGETLASQNPAVMSWERGNYAVRQNQWRYIRYRDGSQELYDVLADPAERSNLIGSDGAGTRIDEMELWLPG